MTIYYVDPEGGTDPALGTANGQSFAQRVTHFNNDTSFIPTAGDEVRIIGSPDPTLLGSGSVKRLNLPSSYYGWQGTLTQTTTAGTSNFYYQGPTAMPGSGTYPGHNLETGDTVWFFGWTDAAQRGLNGTWEVTKVDDYNFTIDGYQGHVASTQTAGYWVSLTGRRVKLSSAVTKNIACHGTRVDQSTGNFITWTPINATGISVTCDLAEWNGSIWGYQGNVVESYRSDKIEVSQASASSGCIAYFNIGTTSTPVDFSAYEQVSLKYRTTYGFPSGVFSLRLCTGLDGANSVHTIDLACNGAGDKGWMSLTEDFGTALSSSIRSVAIYRDASSGSYTPTLFLSNIIACKASSANDCLTHTSLVGLNTTDDPDWYPVESINGTRVLLRGQYGQPKAEMFGYYYQGNVLGWSATNSNADIYIRKTLRRDLNFTGSQAPGNSMSSNNPFGKISSQWGSSSSRIKISGGWDRTSMSTQNLEMSYIDGVVRDGYGIWVSSSAYFEIEKVGFVRFNRGMYVGGYYGSLKNVAAAECYNGIDGYIQSTCDYLQVNHANNCQYAGVNLSNIIFKYYSSTYGEVQATYADRDRYKIRASANSVGTYFHQFYGYSPFKYIDGLANTSYCVQLDNSSGSFEIESMNVDLGRSQIPGLYLNIIGKATVHSISAINRNAAVFAQKGEHTIVQCNNPIYFNPTGGTLNQAGDYPGAWGEALVASSGAKLKVGTATASSTFSSRVQAGPGGELLLENCSITYSYGGALYASTGGIIRVKNSAGYTVRNLYGGSGIIIPDTTTVKTSGGTSWQFRYLSGVSVVLPVGKVAVNSGTQASVSVWIYAQGLSSTEAVNYKLRVDGANVGLSSNLETDFSSNFATYSWKQLTVNFTPTTAGIVDVFLVGGNATPQVNFDEMSATQA